MKKRKLSLEELVVDSFATMEPGRQRGTVVGHVVTEPETFAVNDMCTAGCTEYCMTDGDGGGNTCDVRCYSRENCDSWQCGQGTHYALDTCFSCYDC
jgi:hypothetical protein